MTYYLLDTSALLTLRDNESGAEQVAELLYQAASGEVNGLICFISLMEVLYRVWKDEGEQEGRLAFEQVHSLPLTIIHESAALLEKAAAIKATHRLSLADAWIGAAALLEGATLVHKDPEFDCLQCLQMPLPYKEKK
ncbi:MAG TPA: PIN domain-containing protein [Desulfobulbus sp.]|nr:PIN domain-containing protein [Desulfobulbus sp.]